MSNILNDRIIDDQGNARTVANGQDARLSYIDVFGNRKKYLLEGEASGGDVKVPTKTSELQNDSGFITADDIPATDADLSNYVTQGNINFTTTDANGNITNKFSQQNGYTQLGYSKTNLIDLYGNYLKWYQQNNQSYPFYGVDFSSAAEFKLPENTTINGNKINSGGSSNPNIIRDLTFEDDKIAEDNTFVADFNGAAVQRYSTTNAISDGIINFNLVYSEYQSNTCPTIQVMIPYITDLTTFYFPSDIQEINIPQQIVFNTGSMYNYAVFVFRRIGNQFYLNYSYSYGSN